MDEKTISIIRVYSGIELIDFVVDETKAGDFGEYEGRKDLEFAGNLIYEDDIDLYKELARRENNALISGYEKMRIGFHNRLEGLERKVFMEKHRMWA